ncbi:DEAD/DEAH box helicase [Bradyrhizobium prioriisuperbiae]|uniref:DEAD/DEAH box helicase n=1 Tax=Bradyrhizobium prioriisuperbiae TaxID=2854389 RepID=UPI0028EC73C2|nr:DEAD/DEAH box helicase [Bradyrhizobium prioritasuperba]
MTFQPTYPSLSRALAERHYHEATPVQTAVLADEAAGQDLLVSAQTGSGKTVAYGLAIAANLLGDSDRFEPSTAPLALIVAPTRELALQVHRELAWLYQHAGARVVSCVGGMDPRKEQRELAAGAHIVVGTPGRLCDHLRRNRLDISELKVVVLDEADEMLNMGFREDMEFILKEAPESRRTLLFSATIPRGIAALAKQYQQQAFRIEVAGTEGGHADIEYRAIRIAPHDVEHAIINVLRFFESPSAIVFCNTRHAVRHLQGALLERGFSVVALSGELTQNERTTALQALRDGHARVCVATDVAARGIDLPNLGLVINADLPNDPEVMQHRSGRTGRAGKKGVSVLLVPNARKRRAELLLSQAGIDAVWGTAPQAEDIRKLDQERMLKDTLFSEESTEDDLTLARALLAERSPEDIAAALARLYRSRLPSPEDILDPGERSGRTRDDRGPRPDRVVRDDDRDSGPKSKKTKARMREGMAEGSVWFRAAIGRQKNAEARWLLPMICRRGGIDKNDIGAIRIFENSTEFEISKAAAELFATKIKRPDKEDNIRIEALPDGPQGDGALERPAGKPPHRAKEYEGKARRDDKPRSEDKPRYEDGPKRHGKPFQDKPFKDKPFKDKPFGDKPFGKPRRDDKPRFDDRPAFDKDRRHDAKPAHGGKPSHAGKASHADKPRRDDAAPFAKGAFKKKLKKKKNRG